MAAHQMFHIRRVATVCAVEHSSESSTLKGFGTQEFHMQRYAMFSKWPCTHMQAVLSEELISGRQLFSQISQEMNLFSILSLLPSASTHSLCAIQWRSTLLDRSSSGGMQTSRVGVMMTLRVTQEHPTPAHSMQGVKGLAHSVQTLH